jgi:ProP effector
MEQDKLTNQKEALTFLSNKYPKCFFLEGPVKPLKIGIFQDLAAELGDSPLVSKRLLRLSLRHYTSSWRYLSAVKTGAARIDLLGVEGELVEEQHAQHASLQLKESKEKAAKHRENVAKANKKQNNKEQSGLKTKPEQDLSTASNVSEADKSKKNDKRHSRPFKATRKPSSSINTSAASPKEPSIPVNEEELVVDNDVLIKLGKVPMLGTIIDINKDDISVQLKSGMTVKVHRAQLFSAQKAANK